MKKEQKENLTVNQEKLNYKLHDNTLQQLLNLLHEAHYPVVQFTGNMEHMQEEAIFYSQDKIRDAMEILNNLQKSKGE